MQDTLHNTGAGTNTILYDYIPVIVCSCTVKGCNTGLQQLVWLTGVQGCEPPLDKLNAKTELPIFLYFLSQVLFFVFFGSFWTVFFSVISCFSI